MKHLTRDERLRLLQFVCSFAWTDLQVSDGERDLIELMAKHHDFDDADRAQIAKWLEVPPSPEDVDPTRIPREHRQTFLDAIHAVVIADGRVRGSERESLAVFEELLRS